MTTYQSRLKSREEVAEGTMAFHLEKPTDFQFRPGQYVDVTLINPPGTDSQGVVRTFSIASAPYENELLVATRMRNSAFKRVLATLPLGTEVKLEGPMGSFTLHKNRAKAGVFLAGGIGITPFLSMLREAAEERLPQRLYLFYSNRHPKDAAFLNDLEILSKVNANFVFIPSMSAMEKSNLDWPNERGFIDRGMLLRHMDGLKGPIYYIAGPPGMVAAMRDMLTHAGSSKTISVRRNSVGIDSGLWRRSSVLPPPRSSKEALSYREGSSSLRKIGENKNASQDRDQRVRSNRSEHFSSFAWRPFH